MVEGKQNGTAFDTGLLIAGGVQSLMDNLNIVIAALTVVLLLVRIALSIQEYSRKRNDE